MSNRAKYDGAFVESLSVDPGIVAPGLKYNDVPGWDSIGHMSLIAAFEDTFAISMETADIVELASYEKGIEILRKYHVEI